MYFFIKAYFSNRDVAPHLEQYSPMFAHFSSTKNEKFTKPIPIKAKKYKPIWLSIAASIVLLFGIYFLQPQNESLENEYTQEEIAAAQEAFQLLALNFNKGSQQITYLGEFEKNTNKFLK